MADILIRGVLMPEHCGACPCYRLEGAGNGMYLDYCGAGRFVIDDPDKTKRPVDCPIIALPEGHGRLIDGDELASGCDEPYWCRWLSEIEDAPTIVPAEMGMSDGDE